MGVVMKLIATVLFIAMAATAAFAFSGGPPDDRAGNPPGNQTCIVCHSSFDLNSGDGMVLIDVPELYDAETTYPVTISMWDTGQTRWGFEITALDESNEMIGTFVIIDAVNTQQSDNDDLPDFVKHTNAGTFSGDTLATWTFNWVSPVSGSGNVTFYYAANAADADGSTSGDYIYSSSTTIAENVNSVGNEIASIPTSFDVSNSYPNPFNSSTIFNFESVNSGVIDIVVYDVLGKIVRKEKFSNSAGSNRFLFKANATMVNGVYFAQFNSGSTIVTKRMVYMK
jgi:Secretion system C-terminal sorting domain/Reeler domain